MTKKTRRVRRKSTQPKLSQAQLTQPSPTTAASAQIVEEAAGEPVASSSEVDFSKEYRYVVADLKRLFVLAVAILSGIVILSFIL
jgi:hypothetical protein